MACLCVRSARMPWQYNSKKCVAHLSSRKSFLLDQQTTKPTASTPRTTATTTSNPPIPACAIVFQRHPTKELRKRKPDFLSNKSKCLPAQPLLPIFPMMHNNTTNNTLLHRESSMATQITSNREDAHYFRVTYKGVVALLKDPSSNQKSGSYVAYGELLRCAQEDNDVWKVHAILTGGYAIQDVQNLGYLRPGVVQALTTEPVVDTGCFHYKVISTTPLPILTGPMVDAPKTKAVAMPGSMQEISAIVRGEPVCFLKLSHRRGWIVDRKGTTLVVQETDIGSTDGCSVTTRSTRHRPPRRRRDALPRNVAPREETVPSSNVSILSEDSFARPGIHYIPNSPESSLANTSTSRTVSQQLLYLMRVTTARGLKILDAPQFQVNHLIRSRTTQHRSRSNFVYDGKSRVLPRGALFETSSRLEPGYDGAGLLKLADNSGWAVIPKGESGYVEVGSGDCGSGSSLWVRVLSRTGVVVACPPPTLETADVASPTSSRGGTSVTEMASSVGSGFLDSVFRTPPKRPGSEAGDSRAEKSTHVSTIIPCGMFVEVEVRAPADTLDEIESKDNARLCGGQGWIPLKSNGKMAAARVPPPQNRCGSFWFRVQSSRGIKVRLGPSRRAPSIKSDDGEYFRFECGEFLRASEVVVAEQDGVSEAFAKLYRNRHLRLHLGHEEFRSLASLTAQAEWVQISDQDHVFLEECVNEPIIERHRQGWRYTVVPEDGVEIRKGPSFASEKTGIILFGGEAVAINERVSVSGGQPTWLRMKDGSGWVHEFDSDLGAIMISHSLRHQSRPRKPKREADEAAYNTIIARLFQNENNGFDPTVPQPSSSTDT